MLKEVFLGLGTNDGDRENNLGKAVENISKTAGKIIAISHVYETEPWGFECETWFLNLVVQIKTYQKPRQLLKNLLRIEKQMGKIIGRRDYTSRPIDIDILLYEDEIINEDDLIIPHPLIAERKFVLVPICDIASDQMHPLFKKTFAELLNECKDKKIVRIFRPFSFSPGG